MAAPPNSLLDPAILERINSLTLVARRVVEGVLHGLHQAPQHGLSIEFVQHRAYTPGDETKHLDWRVLGRSDRYVVKQYQQETNLRAVIFLDCSRSMAFAGAKLSAFGLQPSAVAEAARALRKQSPKRERGPSSPPSPDSPARATDVAGPDGRSKFHYARRLAAALSYLLLHQGDSVGLVLTNYQIVRQVAPRATPGQIMTICHALERVKPDGITDVSGVLEQLAPRLKRRSLVILISDLLDDPKGVLTSLGQLYHRGHEVVVFQVLDPREMDFDLGLAGHGITVVRDMETSEEFDAEPALIRELVRAEVHGFLEELDVGARRHNIPLLRCPTNRPLERVVADYLHRRLGQKRLGRLSPAASRASAATRADR